MSPERHLQAFVDALYAEAADADPLAILPLIYSALRKQVSFSSAAFLQFDPPDWTVAACYTHDIGPDLLPSLTEPNRGMADTRIRLPGLRHPNEVLGMAECLDAERVRRGEFGEALRRLGDGRCIALLPFVRGIPMGAFGIHRPRSMPEFDREERARFRWFVTQAARALDYRQLVERAERIGPAIMIVSPAEARVISFTDEAQALLAALPNGEMLTVPADANHTCLWVVGDRTYVVRSMDFLPDLILSTGAIGNLSLNAPSKLTRSKVQFVPGGAQHRALILIEPLEKAVQARSKLSGFGLTPRQEEVALLLALGKTVRDIARNCGISANTAKDHVTAVYHRLDVHSREALLSKLTGIAGKG